MASATIPGVYAAALIEVARERHTIEAVVVSCRKLAEALTPDALRPLEDPRVGKQNAKLALGNTVAHEPKEVYDLLQILVDRNRLDQTSAILREAVRLYEEQEGIVHVQVTLATETEASFKQVMTERVRSRNGAKAVLELRVDPTLVSGFTSRTGDRYVDASGRRVLAEIRQAMLATPLPDSLWGA
jgi:ATP synthase F1 delta subunit